MSETRVERSRLPPVAWFFILVVGLFVLVAIGVQVYEGFSNSEVWKDLALSLIQSCFVASLVCYFTDGRSKDGEPSREVRERVIEGSVQASRKGLPWYIAPVLWVPVSMLSIVWYFSS